MHFSLSNIIQTYSSVMDGKLSDIPMDRDNISVLQDNPSRFVSDFVLLFLLIHRMVCTLEEPQPQESYKTEKLADILSVWLQRSEILALIVVNIRIIDRCKL